MLFFVFFSGCLSCLTVLLFNLIWLFPAHHSIVSHFFLFAVVSTRSVFVWCGGVRGCSASYALTMVNPMPVEGAEEASQVRITGENNTIGRFSQTVNPNLKKNISSKIKKFYTIRKRKTYILIIWKVFVNISTQKKMTTLFVSYRLKNCKYQK